MKGTDKQTSKTKQKMREKWAVRDSAGRESVGGCGNRSLVIQRRRGEWGKGSFTLYYFQFLGEAVIHDIFYYRKS